VQTNFILRDKWFNGAYEDGRLNRARMDESRREYVENMFGSDYVLCTRGSGNFSIRFYETLSSGRIRVKASASGWHHATHALRDGRYDIVCRQMLDINSSSGITSPHLTRKAACASYRSRLELLQLTSAAL
jgi:hypothetical protein